jgi:hypothetical protein
MPGEDAYRLGSPMVTLNSALRTTTHATGDAPAARRHDGQWHKLLAKGSPVIRYRTALHRQPPIWSSNTLLSGEVVVVRE